MRNGNILLNFFQNGEDNIQRRLSKSERLSGLLVTFLTLLVGVLILIFFILVDSESNAMLGWMIYYFVFWILPMQDYKLGLAKREEKHLLSWIFLCGFHLLFLEAFCMKMICKGLGSRERFPPLYFLAVAALPLPMLVLSLPVKVYLAMNKKVPCSIMVRSMEDRQGPGECPRVVRERPLRQIKEKSTKKESKMPPPSYSEIEELDLPAYGDLEFRTEDMEASYVVIEREKDKVDDDKKQPEYV